MVTQQISTDNFGNNNDVGNVGDGISPNPFSIPVSTTVHINSMIVQILSKNWENVSLPLNEWQKSQLENLGESGVRCLLDMWFTNPVEDTEEVRLVNLKKNSSDMTAHGRKSMLLRYFHIKMSKLAKYEPNRRVTTKEVPSLDAYCNATWDNVYCWPQTQAGNVVSRPCSEVLQETEPKLAHHIQGKAVRICLDNGTWLWNKWTNYTECADSYDEYIRQAEEERKLVVVVQYVLFSGSILSLMCLSMALLIFYYFKCLRCDRVTVHIHLMMALLLRSALLIVITEPFIFNRTSHYRHVDIICKAVLSVNLYSTVASVNWMFIQGLYLHGKLTTNVFDKGTPFRIYYLIGWILPLGLIIAYATVLEIYHPVQCWKDYSERSDMWILLGPMIFALLANLIFLINIMRILLTKVQRPSSVSDSAQFRRAVKATFVLFPLLGINNLLFLYNPGGEYHKFFVVFNAIFGSTQGISVSILYCFVSKDVRDAINRLLRRYTVRRTANSMRMTHSPGGSVLRQSICRPRAHFRSTFKRCALPDSATGGRRLPGTTSTPELVMLHQVLPNTSSPSPFGTGYMNGPFLQQSTSSVFKPINRDLASVQISEV